MLAASLVTRAGGKSAPAACVGKRGSIFLTMIRPPSQEMSDVSVSAMAARIYRPPCVVSMAVLQYEHQLKVQSYNLILLWQGLSASASSSSWRIGLTGASLLCFRALDALGNGATGTQFAFQSLPCEWRDHRGFPQDSGPDGREVYAQHGCQVMSVLVVGSLRTWATDLPGHCGERLEPFGPIPGDRRPLASWRWTSSQDSRHRRQL